MSRIKEYVTDWGTSVAAWSDTEKCFVIERDEEAPNKGAEGGGGRRTDKVSLNDIFKNAVANESLAGLQRRAGANWQPKALLPEDRELAMLGACA